jgi:membrane protease YdiL (CAAX protease family)
MALGWVLHVGPYGYLLLGIPLGLIFQIFVRREPLRSVWIRDSTKLRLDRAGILLALAFMIAPVCILIEEWSNFDWLLRIYFFAAIFGAVGVAFTLRQFNAVTMRSLGLCLATAGVLGIAMTMLVAVSQGKDLSFSAARAAFAARQFMVLLPICFVLEEVVFRGVLDSHVHRPQDRQPWISALVLSALWGWWHLPITPPAALLAGAIVFPITHAFLGVPFSLLWRRSGNLFVPASIHALVDAVRNTLIS